MWCRPASAVLGHLAAPLLATDRVSASGPVHDMRQRTHPLVSGRGREPCTTISFTATEHACAGVGPNYNSALGAPCRRTVSTRHLRPPAGGRSPSALTGRSVLPPRNCSGQ